MEAPKRGRPRAPASDEKTQKKRDYQRNYQTARKNKITELTADIKKCEADLKKMKEERKQLRDQARENLRAVRQRFAVSEGRREPAPSVIPV